MFLPTRHNYCMAVLPIPLFHSPRSCVYCCPGHCIHPCPSGCILASAAGYLLPHPQSSEPRSPCPIIPVAVHDGVEAVGNGKDSAGSKLTLDGCLD